MDKIPDELERAARELCRQNTRGIAQWTIAEQVDHDWPRYTEQARACISAALSEPSDELRKKLADWCAGLGHEDKVQAVFSSHITGQPGGPGDD